MKSILLLGAGRYGRHIAEKLGELGHQVMVVDQDEDKVDDLMDIVQSGQIGNCTDKDFLASLGVNNFDVCLVTICEDLESSLVIVSSLKDLGAVRIVAWAANDFQERFLKMAGADEVVYPQRQLGSWAAVRYSSDHVLDYFQLGDSFAVFEVAVPEEWEGKSLLELDLRRKYHINVIAVKRRSGMDINIDAENEFQLGDTVLVVGMEKDVQKYFRM